MAANHSTTTAAATTTSHSRAIELNNRAAWLLQQSHSNKSDHLQALTTFRHAIDSLRHSMEQGNATDDVASSMLIHKTGPSSSSSLMIRRDVSGVVDVSPDTFERLPIASCIKEAELSPHNKFSFYCRTLLITNNNHIYNNDCLLYTTTPTTVATINNSPNDSSSTITTALLSMTILFNMAVTSHLIGLESCHKQEHRLQSALAIYNMLLQVMETSLPPRAGPVFQTYTRILLLATLSNLGHIHSHLCQAFHAEVCRNQLAAFLANHPETRYSLQEDEYMTFYLNTAIFGTPVTRNWAPAA